MQIKTKTVKCINLKSKCEAQWSEALIYFSLCSSHIIPLFYWFLCLIIGTSEGGGSLTSLGVNTSEQKKSSLFLPHWEINLLQSVCLPRLLSLCVTLPLLFCRCHNPSLRCMGKIKRYNQINISEASNKPPAAGVPLLSAGVNYSDPYQDFRSQTFFIYSEGMQQR